MHSNFYKIFQDFVESYRDPTSEAAKKRFQLKLANTARSAVLDALDAAKEALLPDRKFRPDGELFLMVCLEAMVALPLAQDDSPTSLNDELVAELSSDARAIVRAAAEIEEDRPELPASHVLWGAANVLENLNLKKWRLWEKD